MLSQIFWNSIIVITAVIEWCIYDFILGEISELRVSSKKKNIFLIILIVYSLISNLMVVNVQFKLISGIIAGAIYYLRTYKVKFFKGIATISIFWMILITSDLISSSIIPLINSLDSMDQLLDNNSARLQLIILAKALLFLSIPVVRGVKLIKELSYRELLSVSTPILGNIFSMVLVGGYALNNRSNDMKEYFIIFMLSIILLCSNISLVFIISNFIKTTKIKIENKVIKENLELQLTHYTQQKEVEDKIRKMYHDISNHVVCLESVYRNNLDAQKYIDAIKNEIKDYSIDFKTQNIILDAILYQKSVMCKKEKINFDAKIDFSKCDFIENLDVCTIFSNMLDNAIEANQKIDENKNRYINLKGATK